MMRHSQSTPRNPGVSGHETGRIRNMKIIVIDDEPIIADTLVNILRGEGHDAFAVSSGESAIRLAKMMRPVQPDIVIADVTRHGWCGNSKRAAEACSRLPDYSFFGARRELRSCCKGEGRGILL